MLAAAQAIESAGADTRLTGLGLPSEMAPYIESGLCPWMYLWNPADVGYLAAYAMRALASGEITGAVDEVLSAGALGEKVIVPGEDGGTEIVLGNPMVFDRSNIAAWAEVF